jgi:lipopolysaccharide biosynthesis glycosyltransferase
MPLGTPIQIVFAADANYAMPLSVAICSAARSCDASQRIIFTVLHDNFDSDLQRRVQASLASTGRSSATINWIQTAADSLSQLTIANGYLTQMTYARLLIPQVLGIDVSRALYLDCDIVVLEDISALWETNLDDKVIGAVKDHIGTVSSPRGLLNYRELGMSPGAKYFNAGVLLIDLDKWRLNKISERAFNYVHSYRDVIQMEDQEALNAVLYGAWKELPIQWNWQIEYKKQRERTLPSTERAVAEKRNIVHFTTAEKPWRPGCDYEERHLFFEQLDRTEWAGWRVPLTKELSARVRRGIQDFRDTCGRLRRFGLKGSD